MVSVEPFKENFPRNKDLLWEKIPYLFFLQVTEGSRGEVAMEQSAFRNWLNFGFPLAVSVSLSGLAGIYHSRPYLCNPAPEQYGHCFSGLCLRHQNYIYSSSFTGANYLKLILSPVTSTELSPAAQHVRASVCTYIWFRAVCAVFLEANHLRHFAASNQVSSSL